MEGSLRLLACAAATALCWLMAACGASSTQPRVATAPPAAATPSPIPTGTPDQIPPPTDTPAAPASPAPTNLIRTGIKGVAELGPTCPVERVGAPPCTQPVAANIVVTDQRGQVVARATAASNGIFEIALDPGIYNVIGTRPGGGRMGAQSSVRVTVAAGRLSTITLQFDTGIR